MVHEDPSFLTSLRDILREHRRREALLLHNHRVFHSMQQRRRDQVDARSQDLSHVSGVLATTRQYLVLEHGIDPIGGHFPARGEVLYIPRNPANDARVIFALHHNDIAPFESEGAFFVHTSTGRHFADNSFLVAYQRQYDVYGETHNRHPRFLPLPANMVPPATQGTFQTPKASSSKRAYYATAESFEVYKAIYFDLAGLQGEYVPMATVARNMPTPINGRTFGRYLKKFAFPYPP